MIAAATNVSQAIPPDRVSRAQYGTISALMGIEWTLAVVIGTLLGESLSIRGADFASAGLLVALIVPYLVRHDFAPSRDRRMVGAGWPQTLLASVDGLKLSWLRFHICWNRSFELDRGKVTLSDAK